MERTKKIFFAPIIVIAAVLAILTVALPRNSLLQASTQAESQSRVPQLTEKNTIASNSQMTFGEFTGGHDVTGDHQTWIILGYWKTNLFSLQNIATTTTTNQGSGQSASADSNNYNKKTVLISNNNSPSNPTFYANITLLRLDGSMPIVHTIKDFALLDTSIEANGLRSVFKGTSTVDTIAHNQITNVPTTITVTLPEKADDHNIVVNVFPDPSKVNYEFGKTPLFSLWRNYDPSIPTNLLNVPLC